MERVLFLDVDGVLNRCGASGQGLTSDKVALLQQIVEACDPVVVISSTWRCSDQPLQRLVRMLFDIGARYGGTTPCEREAPGSGLPASRSRGDEIQQWIDENGRPDRLAILDDDPDMGDLLPYLFETEPFVGLTEEISESVISSLSGS